MGKLKVLFHINEPERWQRVLTNITNFINDAGQDNVDVEVVANGGAVVGYAAQDRLECGCSGKDSAVCGKPEGKLLEEMKRLAGMGISFTACRNALKMNSMDESTLPPFVTVIPAGITEITVKQGGGYAYIKP
ncbi:MAG: hypothetical protein ACOY46_09190 [Bacillota bacterium]